MKTEYMEDCVHLHACRRISKFHKIRNRGCNSNCSAYLSAKGLIKVERAIEIAQGLLQDRDYGYSMDDLVVEAENFMENNSLGGNQ